MNWLSLKKCACNDVFPTIEPVSRKKVVLHCEDCGKRANTAEEWNEIAKIETPKKEAEKGGE